MTSKLSVAAGLAALALAWGSPARAEDVQKAKNDAQQDVNKARTEAQKDEAKARENLQKTEADANAKVHKAETKADQKVQDARESESRHAASDTSGSSTDMHDRNTLGMPRKEKDSRRTMFEGKDNWDVKGRIARVSGSSVTLHRDDLPDVTLKTSSGTRIEVNGNPAKVSQLRAGEDVRASFNLQGSSPMAVEIKADAKKSDTSRTDTSKTSH